MILSKSNGDYKMLVKILFIVVAIGGIVLVFFVSWFWRLLLLPMILILLWDGVIGFLKKKS